MSLLNSTFLVKQNQECGILLCAWRVKDGGVCPINGADAMRINQDVGSIGKKLDIAALSVENLELSHEATGSAIKKTRARKYRTSGPRQRVKNVKFRC